MASAREGWFQGMSDRLAAILWFTHPQTAIAAKPKSNNVVFMPPFYHIPHPDAPQMAVAFSMIIVIEFQ